jgi:hypothetical protein
MQDGDPSHPPPPSDHFWSRTREFSAKLADFKISWRILDKTRRPRVLVMKKGIFPKFVNSLITLPFMIVSINF